MVKGPSLRLAVVLFWLLSELITATPPAAAQGPDRSFMSPDLDGDGLSNAVETAGWCDAAGCFQTDPLNADSDADGLTDGEEKLFEANPNDSASPGIYVVYDNSLKTKEYYPWQRYGSKLIARGDTFSPPDPDQIDVEHGLPTDLDAVVVRRGTTFYVGGPLSATLQINKSISSLTTLTPTQDGCTGKWRVSVPSDGTVGKYTLTLGSKSLDLFVIFELPTPSGELTQSGIQKFLYDDNPNSSYDTRSVLLYVYRYPGAPDPEANPPLPYTIPSGEEIKEGHSYTFQNEQYNRYMLEDYVIGTINGKTNQRDAANALVVKTDQETVFRNPRGMTRSWRVLNPGSDPRVQCSDVSGLLSAFNRAAGIPAHPVMVDWRHSTFDHADEVWLNGTWQVYRGYTTLEMGEFPDDTHLYQGDCAEDHGLWPACGIRPLSTRSDWGTSRYKPWHSGGRSNGNIIVAAGDDWTGTGTPYRWASWDIGRILLTQTKMRTYNTEYWANYGWTQEPVDYGDTPSTSWPDLPPASPTGVAAVGGNGQVTVSWNSVAGATSYNLYYRTGSSVDKIYYGTKIAGVTSPYTVTPLSNGTEYAFAVAAVGPTGESPLSTVVRATPTAPPLPPTGVAAVPGDGQATVSWNAASGATSYNLYYRAGSSVNKSNGTQITGVISPHTVAPLTNDVEYAFAVASVGPTGESDLSTVVTATPTASPPPGLGAMASGPSTLATASTALASQSAPVQLGDVVAEYGVDVNGNGQYDQLVIEVQVTAARPGDYWLLGELNANPSQLQSDFLRYSGGLVANALLPAHLVEGSQTVKFIFDGLSISSRRANGPYTLGNVRITDVKDPGPDDFNTDSLDYRDYAYSTAAYRSTDFETYGALLSGNYNYHDLDGDGDGRPDALVLETGINVYQPGSYTVQGSLYDNQDKFIARATWTGAGPAVTLRFDKVAGTFGPYTVRDLDLLDAAGQSIDYIAEAVTTTSLPALVSPDQASFDILPAGGDLTSQGLTITPTLAFSTSIVDGNLQFQAEVQVAQAGSYKIEAWLADANGNLLTWAGGQPADLPVGTQALSLTFDGRTIRTHGVAGPYQVVALKVLDGTAAYTVLDKVDVALTTQAYTLNQFAAVDGVILEDFVESGGSRWTAASPWAISQNASFSPSHAWYGSNADASLTLTAPLNFSNAVATLRLRTCQKLNASTDKGYVEASTDGSHWDTLATFTENAPWATHFVSLGDYANQGSVRLRFRLASAGGATGDAWYLDDILVAGLPDSDADGLSDEDENDVYHTDPNDPDSDNDGMFDGWEVNHGLNPLVNDASGDPDQDGLTNLEEYQHHTNPHLADTDVDGMPDGWEVDNNLIATEDDAAGDPDHDGLTNLEEYQHGTNPQLADTDGDGLSDGQEVNTYHTNPLVVDTDGDSLSDGQEVNTYHTNPLVRDTDGDGMPDDWEVANGLIATANDAAGDLDNDGLTNLGEYQHGTDPQLADSESDGMPDGWEVDNNLLPLTNDAAGDPDGDGLTNLEEYQLGSDPHMADADGDGISDGIEVGPDPSQPINTDGDALIDALDLDSDADGILDATEWDADQNASRTDDLCANNGLDTDGDHISNCQDNDVDGDGMNNYRDLDSDGDGLLDADEGTGDTDGDGIPNWLDSDLSFNEPLSYVHLPIILR